MDFRRIIMGALCALAAACATPMAEQQPTLANIQLLRTGDMPSLAVGAFQLAHGLPPGMDHAIAVRADSLHAPGDGSFAHYLRSTLETELRGAGKLDPQSAIVISGDLTQGSISTNLPNSRASLGARFRATRAGEVVFDKELVVSDEWQSNFLGAIAIPMAEDRYTALYPRIVTALLSDQQFRAAVHRAN